MGMIRKILNINGADRSFICDSEKDMLSDVIRNLGLTGTKIGCGKGQCGACNVILNGKLVRSCVTKISKVEDYSTVYTIEGMGTANNLHPIQLAWMVYGGGQCGFCTPGFVVSPKALLDENPNPTREDVRAWFQKYKNACRCTGYKPIVDAVMAAAKVMRGELTMEDLAFKLPKDGSMIGSKAPKPSAVGKVLGTTDFGADVADKVPGMVHLAMVVPPVNHGIIKSIDISEAEKAPGVIKVILAKDLPGNRMSYPQTSIWALGDGCERPLICDEKVFRFGDPVAVVAAETRRQAREAAKMVRYEIEELPAYMDVLESVKPDAMEIHPGLPNLYVQKPLFKGDDPRDIIKNAPYSVEFNFGVQRQPHFTIEPDCCNAFVEEDGTLTVMYKTHGIYMLKGLLAKTLGLPDDKVRVVLNPSGGAFGYTLSPALPCLTAACALVLGRPASFVLSYEEHIRYTGKRSPNYTNTRLACDENGKILASDTHVLIDKGCYSETGAPLINSLMKFIYNNYNMPSTRCLVSGWEWYASLWCWLRASRLCAYAIYLPSANRIEPTVLPLTCINVE